MGNPFKRDTKQVLGICLVFCSIITIFILPFIPASSYQRVDADFMKSLKVNSPALLFFGYPACSDICPTTMITFQKAFQEYQKTKNNDFGVVFIDLTSRFTSEQVQDYAKTYHPSFIGFQPTLKKLFQLKNEFGVMAGEADDKGVISHDGKVYVLKKNGSNWYKVYTFLAPPVDPNQILDQLDRI